MNSIWKKNELKIIEIMPFPPLFIARRFFIRPYRQGLWKKTPLPLIWLSSFPRLFFFSNVLKWQVLLRSRDIFYFLNAISQSLKKHFKLKCYFLTAQLSSVIQILFTFLKTYKESICGVQKLILCLKCIFHFLKKKLRSVVKHSRHLIQPANRKL